MAYDAYGCSLYVGNLDPRVCTELLEEIFGLVRRKKAGRKLDVLKRSFLHFIVLNAFMAGEVKLCKVVGDKNTGQSLGFGFVDFADREQATGALEKFNGRTVYGQEMRVDWAHTGTGAAGKFINPNQEDISGHYCLFIGNLSPDLDDVALFDAFAAYGSCSSAKVSRDPETQRASGYGFVSFRERKDAENAIEGLNGQTVGQRPIRVDWARTKTNAATRAAALGLPDPPKGEEATRSKDLYDLETILRQSDESNVTVYVAGLVSTCDEASLHAIMREYGTVDDLRIPESSRTNAVDKAYAFVKFRTHDEAARAIHGCQSRELLGKLMTVTWGRENMRPRGPPRHPMPHHPPPGGYPMYPQGPPPQQPYPQQPLPPPQQPYAYPPYQQAPPPNAVRTQHYAPRPAPY